MTSRFVTLNRSVAKLIARVFVNPCENRRFWQIHSPKNLALELRFAKCIALLFYFDSAIVLEVSCSQMNVSSSRIDIRWS